MTHSTPDQLYKYYQNKTVLPTYAGFTSSEDFLKYQKQRENIYIDKLKLPSQLFNRLHLIEFGPDTGENALVFAKWGADVTLVEPNDNSWPYILNYFKKFNLENKLISLIKSDLEHFEINKKYQIIDAEGFIYTIRPKSTWIRLFNRILEENGFFIISYYEVFGTLMELVIKMIFVRTRDVLNENSNEVAWKLFQAKWDSISHTRSFNSWVMDVLENPFVRVKYFFDAASLCEELYDSGFSLYSSWPNYRDSLSVYWHKKILPPEIENKKITNFIKRSRLSFAFGGKLFFLAKQENIVNSIGDSLMILITSIDGLVDEINLELLKKCNEQIVEIRKVITGNNVLSDSPQDISNVLLLLESIQKIIKFIGSGDANALIAFCNSDMTFIREWGMPNHFAVFTRHKQNQL